MIFILENLNKLTNLEALSFLIVLAFPKASSNVPACTIRSLIVLTVESPETNTRNCKTIRVASVFPEPLSPMKKIILKKIYNYL